MKVLITGGAGFIGARTAQKLVERGHAVTLFDNFSPQIHGADPARSFTWATVRDAVETITGDVRDAAALARIVPAFDAILHLAAETGTGQSMYDIVRYNDVNVMGTANLLEAIVRDRGRVAKLVVASSRSIYGEGAYRCRVHGDVYPPSRSVEALAAGRYEPSCPLCGEDVTVAATPETAQLSPASVYAATKLAQENLVLAVARAVQLPAYALRYQNVYGAGQSLSNPYTGILSIFSREMLAGRDIEIFEDGHESRDFVHVDDIAAINVAALEADQPAAVALNVGSGAAVTVLDLAERLAAIYGFTGNIKVSGRFRAGDIRHNFADTTLLKATLGIDVAVDFATGLADFAAWVREQAPPTASSGYRESLDELGRRGLMGARAGA